jgi:VWFA-related protein
LPESLADHITRRRARRIAFAGRGAFDALMAAAWCAALLALCTLHAAAVPAEQQDVPDAPSATRQGQLPDNPAPNVPPPDAPSASRPADSNPPDTAPRDVGPPPGSNPATRGAAPPPSATGDAGGSSPTPPAAATVPPGGGAGPPGAERDQLYKIVSNVNFVVVPVTVKDPSGRLVQGLLQKNFSVYENGVKQPIRFFTSDPFPLSAAVVVDTGLPQVAMQKVAQTLPAIQSAFSQFDEISLYTYSNTVHKVFDFTAINRRVDQALKDMKNVKGATGTVPVTGGPINSGPTVNGMPVDQGAPAMINTPARESHVLNDAILAAALELGKRDPTRRKIIFIVSDGHEWHSNASYRDVLKVLLSRNIGVYAVGVDTAAIPGLRTVEKLHIPRFGESDILPKYASATGGQVSSDFSQKAIESAYAQLAAEARNQYTIGYTTRATPSTSYREIDVRVDHPDLNVFAKTGYYPLPLTRQ